MNKLLEIKKMGFKVTWRLISIGLYGLSYIEPQLAKEDVFFFLDGLLVNESNETDRIISLICEREDDIKTDKMIRHYEEIENANPLLELRKWRAYLLKKTLEYINDDTLQGLLELTEFWVSIGMPEGSPHEYPNADNVTSSYFTKENYLRLKNRNENWLCSEMRSIMQLDKAT